VERVEERNKGGATTGKLKEGGEGGRMFSE